MPILIVPLLVASAVAAVELAPPAPVAATATDLCALATDLVHIPADDVARLTNALGALEHATAAASPADECYAALETALRRTIFRHHRAAQKSKRYDEYRIARAAYDAYSALPGIHATADGERYAFFRAELLWDLGEWREAAAGYRLVVERWPMGEYALVCAYNELLTWEKAIANAPVPRVKNGKLTFGGELAEWRDREDYARPPPRPPAPPRPPPPAPDLSDDERALLASLVRYERLRALRPPESARQTEELVVVLFKHAHLLHVHELRRAEALPLFREIIERAPASEYARKAAELLEPTPPAAPP